MIINGFKFELRHKDQYPGRYYIAYNGCYSGMDVCIDLKTGYHSLMAVSSYLNFEINHLGRMVEATELFIKKIDKLGAFR